MSTIESGSAQRSDALEWLARYGLDACELDDRTQVRETLATVQPSVRRQNPACLAVEAALQRFEGHVDSAVTLYERALRLKMDPELEIRIRENLGHLFLSRRQDSECEMVIGRAETLASGSDPRILSLKAVVRARRRDARVVADLDALESSMSSLSDLERARIYRRMWTVAYEGLADPAKAERYLHLVIEHAEVASAHGHAAVAYWALSSLYSNDVGDSRRTLEFLDLMSEAAIKAGDSGLLIASVIDRFGIAAEIGDKTLLASLRERLRDVQGAERYNEQLALVFGEAMSYGWAGAFEKMRQYLLSVNLGRIISANRPLHQALIAIGQVGSGLEEEGLKSAYLALSLGKPLGKEPWLETRQRLIARILSGAILLHCNRRTEAMRALTSYEARMTPSLIHLRDAVVNGSYSTVQERAADVYGYALLCEAFARSNQDESQAADLGLTRREIDILRASAAGRSAKAIAEELEIAQQTVEWHRKNVLKKLSVNSTIAAIAKARELQLIP